MHPRPRFHMRQSMIQEHDLETFTAQYASVVNYNRHYHTVENHAKREGFKRIIHMIEASKGTLVKTRRLEQ